MAKFTDRFPPSAESIGRPHDEQTRLSLAHAFEQR